MLVDLTVSPRSACFKISLERTVLSSENFSLLKTMTKLPSSRRGRQQWEENASQVGVMVWLCLSISLVYLGFQRRCILHRSEGTAKFGQCVSLGQWSLLCLPWVAKCPHGVSFLVLSAYSPA